MAEQCPYCSEEVEEKKETILRVAEEYDPKTVEQLNKMLQVFEQLLPYFSADTQSKMKAARPFIPRCTGDLRSAAKRLSSSPTSTTGAPSMYTHGHRAAARTPP